MEDYLNTPEILKTSINPDFRFQIYRFSRKAFTQIEELKKGGQVCWLDADIETQSKADINKIKKMLKEVCIAYMGRENFHPCTSFVGFNCNHPDMVKFLSAYESIYTSFDVFKLREWHDAYVFDYILKETKVKSRNISENIKGKSPHFNVFNYCFPFARHKKGNLK